LTKVRALVAGTACATTRDGDDLVIKLPDIERFEVVLIEGGH
jgi:hypothetical protein